MHYDWQASLALLALAIVITKVGKWLAFKVPALARERELNFAADQPKIAMEKYPPIIAATRKIGLLSNLLFFVVIAPFFVTLQSQSVVTVVVGIVTILMVYDFFTLLPTTLLNDGKKPTGQVIFLMVVTNVPSKNLTTLSFFSYQEMSFKDV